MSTFVLLLGSDRGREINDPRETGTVNHRGKPPKRREYMRLCVKAWLRPAKKQA